MVYEVNADNVHCVFEFCGCFYIVGAGLGISAGMIVGEDNAGCRAFKGNCSNDAAIYIDYINAADSNAIPAKEAVTFVQA